MKRLTARMGRRGALGAAGVLLTAAIVVGAWLNTASSYSYEGVRWEIQPGQSVPYVVSRVLSDDMIDMDCLNAVQIGYNAWTVLTCSYMAWEYQGRTDNTAWGAGDGENVASWRDEFWDDSPAALAIAAWQTGGIGGGIGDCDIKFNGFHHGWTNVMDGGGGGATDVASVSAHEVGHCNGFGHSDVAGATMWPSTGPGDPSGRSLSADDIEALCDTYPSGGEVPEPMEPPPLFGDVDFGEDCSADRCMEGLFCLNDGRDLFCSRSCETAEECGPGFYCARLSNGDGACARGEDPMRDRAGFGEDCSEGRVCQQGLVCVNDEGLTYCTGPCLNDMCPGGFFCTELRGGATICARGEGAPGDLPGAGQPCTDRGLCERGLFCIRDALNTDPESGEVVPYCTAPCDDNGMCDDGFRCIDLPPSGTACQLIPTAGDSQVGDECFVNPERPFERPTCGNGLECVDSVQMEQEWVEPGFCTKSCDPDDCCPSGWGCAEVTPVFAQCRPNTEDSPRFACAGGPPGGDNDGGVDGDSGTGGGGDGDTGGCAAAPGSAPSGWPYGLLVLGIMLVGFGSRRR